MLALLLQLCVTLGLGSVVAYGKTHDRAPSDLIVWGQDYSGMSRIQVSSQLKERIPNLVSFKEQDYPLKMDRSYEEIKKWLDQVFQVPTGFWFTDILHSLARPSKVITSNDFGLNREEILAQLQSLSKIINKPMISATITYSNSRLVKTDGQVGQELDIEGTWLKITHEHEQKRIELVVNDVPALPVNSTGPSVFFQRRCGRTYRGCRIFASIYFCGSCRDQRGWRRHMPRLQYTLSSRPTGSFTHSRETYSFLASIVCIKGARCDSVLRYTRFSLSK